MALPSNRSSCPSMVAGRTSPNSRNSEIGNPVRRSFSGNPFSKPSIVANPRSLNPITPANSPSDYPRRNYVCRENLFTSRDNEEKENGKDQSPIPVRVRSPTVGKSSKHFMSPTISAASKIAASPKKKILGDRNEPIRSSLSFTSMKSSSLNSAYPTPETSTILEFDTNSENASTPKSSKSGRFGGFEVISGSYDDSEMVTMAAEIDAEPEIAPISNSKFAVAPSKSSKTVTFVGFEVIPDSYDDLEFTYDTNTEIVTMGNEADIEPESTPISNSAIAAAPCKASKTVSFADFISNNDLESPAMNNFTEELDSVNLDPSFKISPVSSLMEVAPLDADPFCPPYDPKTNYLSPRPQFLHYRPNRRINRYDPDCKREELFSSVRVSESELEEETDSEDPQMESDEGSSNESQIEEEEREEEDEEEIIDVSEAKAKKSSKPHFSRIFKISSLFLILFTACFSIHIVNVHDPHIFERASKLTMEDFHSSEISAFARTNFYVLVGKLEVWHANSKSFISDAVFNIRGGRPLIYLNQTEFLREDINVDGQCLLLSHQTLWEEENSFNVVEEAMKERQIDIVEESIERSEGQNEEEQEGESLQEIEAMKDTEFDYKPVERESQNEEEQEEESFQEIEAMKPREIEVEPVERSQNEEEESFQEIIAMKNKEFEIESQNEEDEVEEEKPYQEIEAKANDPKDIEEENDEASTETISEASLQENNIEETASDQLNQEENVQEKQIVQNYEVSSPSDFKIHDQIEQEAVATVETEEENNDPMQQIDTEFQYQSPPVSPPPSEPQSDIEEEENSGNLIGTATDHHGTPRDFTQNTAVIITAILLGLSLIIPAGLIYARKSGSKSPSMAAAIAAEQVEKKPLVKETKIQSRPPVVVQEAEAATGDEEEDDHDDDMAGEFCSSETSSFQYSSMKGGRETEEMKRSSEVQSHSSHGRKMRKNSRRESMSSSSLDEYSVSTSASPSYGSFTTYEKIPIKHGNADQEIVTPVRRSSRIRKQHNNS